MQTAIDTVEATRKSLSKIAVGDRVWVSNGLSDPRDRLQTVQRLTKTQVITNGYPDRFRIREHCNSYFQLGKSLTARAITSIATSEECKQYDRMREKRRLEVEAARTKEDKIEAKRQELIALFDDAVVRDDDGRWEVSLWLDESDVRRLATFIKSLSR